MKSAAELREIAEAKRAIAAESYKRALAVEAARIAAENSEAMESLLPKLVNEIERCIEVAATDGKLTIRFTPYALRGYYDSAENHNRYRPILKAACDAIMESDPGFKVRYTDFTGTDYCSDGAFSDGQCEVVIEASW